MLLNNTNYLIINNNHTTTTTTTVTTDNTTYIIPYIIISNDLNLEYLDSILNTMRLICGKILTPLLCIIGFIANFINIIILTREWMSSSTNVYLTAVSLCDLFYLLFTYLFSLWLYQTLREFAPFAYCITIIHGTANLFSNTTTWLTVCFTLERYIVISSPLIGRHYCTKQRARYIVLGIFCICTLLTLPDYFKRTIKWIPINVTLNHYQFIVVDTQFNQLLTQFGYDYVNQIIFVILPMILLIIFNTLLIRSVFHANHKRYLLTKQHSNNNKINTLHHHSNQINTIDNNNDNQLLNQQATTSQLAPIIVRDALEASLRTTINITSSITQSFRVLPTSIDLLPSMNIKRTKLGEQHRITLMLIVIVIAFVLLQLPSMVPTITINLWNTGIMKSTQYTKKCLLIYANISNVLLIINAALNFVFYSLFSSKFRQTCCILLKNITCLKHCYYQNKLNNITAVTTTTTTAMTTVTTTTTTTTTTATAINTTTNTNNNNNISSMINTTKTIKHDIV
ncbi:FMRFamide receptor [Schistosoma japonicum]|uniref:FMRFamide receptor n=1 Tax=Schistosoma japonicum TaxID=6182 RepID=A0A4Z2DHY3_SCHJA|nr:FMRFamide receptor [Schistosoma japonicum]